MVVEGPDHQSMVLLKTNIVFLSGSKMVAIVKKHKKIHTRSPHSELVSAATRSQLSFLSFFPSPLENFGARRPKASVP